jgi:hypothetical protein
MKQANMKESFINGDRAIVANDQSAKVALAKPRCVLLSSDVGNGAARDRLADAAC